MTEQGDILATLRATWRALPVWRRPLYAFESAYRTGLFWVEIISALAAVALMIPALQDIQDWPLSGASTRLVLLVIILLQFGQLLLLHPYSRWLRLVGNSVASSWWCGCSAIMFLVGEFTLGGLLFLLFIATFVSLINVAGSRL